MLNYCELTVLLLLMHFCFEMTQLGLSIVMETVEHLENTAHTRKEVDHVSCVLSP